MCRWLIAAGKRPVPFRTRKLSPPAPMVLPPGGGGRVGYRRPNNFTPTPATHQPRCAAGVALYPTPSTHYARASRTPHCRHCRYPPIPQRGNLVRSEGRVLRPHCGPTSQLHIADTTGTYRFRNADISTGRKDPMVLRTSPPHCGHRRHLDTPECKPGSQWGRDFRFVADFVTALRTPGLPWITDTRIPQYG